MRHWNLSFSESGKKKYLEGATPTRFGPRPLKSERGPSLSRISLCRESISLKIHN